MPHVMGNGCLIKDQEIIHKNISIPNMYTQTLNGSVCSKQNLLGGIILVSFHLTSHETCRLVILNIQTVKLTKLFNLL